jgi:hypothetical protein
MKGLTIQGFTPQQKIVGVNNRFGNTNIKNQQGSTRVLFDSIPFTNQTEFRFFENAASKQYPLTNLSSEGNRLSVGETFVVQKIYFGVTTLDPDTGAITEFISMPGGSPTTFKGELSLQIANSQVIKQIPTDMFIEPTSNPTAVNVSDTAFSTFTDIVIPPLLEYVLTVRVTDAVNDPNIFLVCFMEGTAGILAPQTTF